MRKGEEHQGANMLRRGKAVLLGSLAGFGVGLIFLLLAATGVSRGLIAPGLRYQLTVVACVLGGFVGALTAIRQCPSRSLITGLAVGIGLFLLTLTAGVLLYENVSFENGGLGLLCGALCGGGAAGILGGGGKRSARSGKRKRKRSVR